MENNKREEKINLLKSFEDDKRIIEKIIKSMNSRYFNKTMLGVSVDNENFSEVYSNGLSGNKTMFYVNSDVYLEMLIKQINWFDEKIVELINELYVSNDDYKGVFVDGVIMFKPKHTSNEGLDPISQTIVDLYKDKETKLIKGWNKMQLKKLAKLLDRMVLQDDGYDDNVDVIVEDTEGNKFYIQTLSINQNSLFDNGRTISLKVRKTK